jgi:hypothetical protein
MKNKTNMLQNEAFTVILNYFENKSEEVEQSDELCTALRVLEKIRRNNETLGWKQLGAISAVERYIEKTGGNSPRMYEIPEDKQLPGVRAFRAIFGMPVHKWLLENYPEYTKTSSNQYFYGGTRYSSVEEVQNIFVEEYLKLKPLGQDDFNRRKAKTVPTWNSMSALLNLTSWSTLIDKLGLPRYGQKPKIKPRVTYMNISVSDEESTSSDGVDV